MIQSIRLQYYQGHIDSTFTFDKGVNALIGITDAGKTACVRAIRSVMFNKPRGTKFINHKAFVDGKQVKDCVITLQTDKHLVEKRRGASKNSYTLDGVEYNVVKSSVPDEIKEALNFEDINIQFQLNLPFLLTESSGEVARTMNKIVKLDDIDETQKNINGYRLKLNRDETSLLYEIKQLIVDAQELDYTEIEKTVETVELLEDKKTNLDEKIDLIKSCIYDIIDIDEVLEAEEAILACEKKIDKICEEYEEHKRLSTKVNDLRDFIYDITDIDEYIEEKRWVYEIDVQVLDTLFAKYKVLDKDVGTLSILIDEHEALVDSDIAEIDVDIMDTLFEKYHSLDSNISVLSKIIDEYESLVDADYALVDVKAIEKVHEEYAVLSVVIGTMEGLIEKLQKVNTVIKEGETKVNELEDKLKEETEGICPLCGSVI